MEELALMREANRGWGGGARGSVAWYAAHPSCKASQPVEVGGMALYANEVGVA